MKREQLVEGIITHDYYLEFYRHWLRSHTKGRKEPKLFARVFNTNLFCLDHPFESFPDSRVDKDIIDIEN